MRVPRSPRPPTGPRPLRIRRAWRSPTRTGTGRSSPWAPDGPGPAADTAGVALADVDGDGSLDLVRGIAAGPAELYLNSGGRLALAPWAAPSENTFGIALGDVDGDRRVR